MWDADNINKETKKEILQYRIRILENLAQDSITLAGMQIVALSLLINQLGDVIGYFEGVDNIESLTIFLLDNELALISGLFIIVAMLTSVFCYYTARKKATDLPNALIYLEYSDRTPPVNEEFLDSTNTILRGIGKIMMKYDDEISDIHTSSFEDYINEFNSSTSSEHQLRGKLTFSAVLTFTSILLFSISLINNKFPFSDEFFIVLLVLGLQIYFSFPILNHTLAILERLRQIIRRHLDSILSNLFELIGDLTIQLVKVYPEITLYTIVYFWLRL